MQEDPIRNDKQKGVTDGTDINFFMTDIKEKIKDSHYHKFTGIAPDGFILVPEEVLEQLKDFDVWKEWKSNPELLEKLTKDFCNKIT